MRITGVVGKLVLSAAVVTGLIFTSHAFPRTDETDLPYIPGEVLVKYRSQADSLTRSRFRERNTAKLSKALSRHSIELLKLDGGVDTLNAVNKMKADPLVEYAEPNWRVLPLAEVLPDDPLFPDQWYLNAAFADTIYLYSIPVSSMSGTVWHRVFITLGDSVSIGTNNYDYDVDIDAPEAWAILDSAYPSGPFPSAVGVIDSGLSETGTFDSTSGYSPNHEDFLPSCLFVNGPEAAGLAGEDDDLNGHVDDINGWDWYSSDDADLPGSEPDDDIPGEDPVPADSYTSSAETDSDPTDHSHGTLVSGIFSASWDNGVGMASLGQNRVGVLPLRVYINSTSGIDDIITAIDYAADLAASEGGIRVLNASWRLAGNTSSQALKDVIVSAAGSDMLFVSAAGNSGEDNDTKPVYPASYSVDPDLKGFVLAVGATSYDGHRADFSNFGEISVQIGAPGTFILSTSDGEDGYSFVDGTSFSSPLAAGLAALLAGAHPSMPASAIIDRIVKGGEFDENLAGVFREGKRLNMAGALSPFYPYSKLAYLDSIYSVRLYNDIICGPFGSIHSAASDNPGIAVMKADVSGGWAVSPIAPGITSFELTFPSSEGVPMERLNTGPWRVTAIAPFRVQNIKVGERIQFDTVLELPGEAAWEVEDPDVGTVSGNGEFKAAGEGMTRVVLLLDGVPYDASPPIHVSPRSGGGGGGCGTVLPPDEDPIWPGPVMIILMVITLLSLRRKWLVEVSSELRVQGSE